jgi:hypothetical protein
LKKDDSMRRCTEWSKKHAQRDKHVFSMGYTRIGRKIVVAVQRFVAERRQAGVAGGGHQISAPMLLPSFFRAGFRRLSLLCLLLPQALSGNTGKGPYERFLF